MESARSGAKTPLTRRPAFVFRASAFPPLCAWPAGALAGTAAATACVAVVAGLAALTIIALVAIGVMNANNSAVVSIASGGFGVIGTIVGAYFGVKVGNDSTQKAIDTTSKGIDGMKDESAKAQTFAAHIDPSKVSEAISDYQALRKTL